MALMCLFPLSGECVASFPDVLESSKFPPVPNPILESQVGQPFSLLLVIPILVLEELLRTHTTFIVSLMSKPSIVIYAWPYLYVVTQSYMRTIRIPVLVGPYRQEETSASFFKE